MSNVLWCDPGNHPFKEGAKGSIHFTGASVDDNGNHVTADVDACGDHNPFRAEPKNIVKELNAEYPMPE